MRIIELSKVRIPERYKQTSPKEHKIEQCRRYWKHFKAQDRYIVVDKNYMLLDGYVQYLVLKENHIANCEVQIFEDKRDCYDGRYRRIDNNLYVWGKHYNQYNGTYSKEYVWRVPPSWIADGRYRDLQVGDEVLVQTSRGVKLIHVTRLGNIATFPEIELPKSRIRKIVKNLSNYKRAVREYDSELADMLGYKEGKLNEI